MEINNPILDVYIKQEYNIEQSAFWLEPVEDGFELELISKEWVGLDAQSKRKLSHVSLLLTHSEWEEILNKIKI